MVSVCQCDWQLEGGRVGSCPWLGCIAEQYPTHCRSLLTYYPRQPCRRQSNYGLGFAEKKRGAADMVRTWVCCNAATLRPNLRWPPTSVAKLVRQTDRGMASFDRDDMPHGWSLRAFPRPPQAC